MPLTTTHAGPAPTLPESNALFTDVLALRFMTDVLDVRQDFTPEAPDATVRACSDPQTALASWLLRNWAAPVLHLVPDLADDADALRSPLPSDQLTHEFAARISSARSRACRLAQLHTSQSTLPAATKHMVSSFAHSVTVTTFGVGAVAGLNSAGERRWSSAFDAIDAARATLITHFHLHLNNSPRQTKAEAGKQCRELSRPLSKNLSQSAFSVVSFILHGH